MIKKTLYISMKIPKREKIQSRWYNSIRTISYPEQQVNNIQETPT